jgi:HrpA-like RNA helicase
LPFQPILIVAEEFGAKLGEEVGYTIRFEDETNPV